MNTPINIIVATDQNLGIGKDGQMPWRLTKEIKHFAHITTTTKDPNKKNAVIMGRTTWQSLPEKYRPLQNRHNIILTRNKDFQATAAAIATNLQEAVQKAQELNSESIFIIGGGAVYAQALQELPISNIYITKIQQTLHCDTFFPEIPSNFTKTKTLGTETEGDLSYQYELYQNE